MRPLSFLLGLGVALVLAFLSPATSRAKGPGLAISGRDLPHRLDLPFHEDYDFWRASPAPRVLQELPTEPGPAYTVTSWYWDFLLRGNGPGPEAADEALYYPARGLVRATLGAEVAWLRLDERRQAILGRYTALGRRGLLPPHPTIGETLAAAALHGGETIQVEISGRTLEANSREAQVFWREFAAARKEKAGYPAVDLRRALDQTAFEQNKTYVAFRLPEGRVVELLYLRPLGYLVDLAAGQASGNYGSPTDVVEVSPRLGEVLAQAVQGDAGGGNSPGRRPADGDVPAMPPWALSAIGVGGAAILLGIAAVAGLRRPATR